MIIQIKRRWFERWKPGWTWEGQYKNLTAFDDEPTRPWHRAHSCKYNNCPWHPHDVNQLSKAHQHEGDRI